MRNQAFIKAPTFHPRLICAERRARNRRAMLRRCRPRVTPSLARRLSTRAAAGRLDLEHFASIVGPANVITDRTSLEQYNTDWMRAHVGRAAAAVRPGSTAEVSAILAHCNERRISIVPQGGNTGLVGGSVPVADEVVLSLSRMKCARHRATPAAAALPHPTAPRARAQPHPLARRARGQPRVRGRLHPPDPPRARGLRRLRDAARPRRQRLVPDWRQRVDQRRRAALPAVRIAPRHRPWARGGPRRRHCARRPHLAP